MTRTAVHVVFSNPRWRVEHLDSVHTHHFTKDAASYTGRALAKRMSAELIIHDTDGGIGGRESYAKDATVAS